MVSPTTYAQDIKYDITALMYNVVFIKIPPFIIWVYNRMSDLSLINDQDTYVTMSNKAARGAQGLSLREKRLVALAISKNHSLIQKMGIGYDQRRIKITVLEYANEYAIDRKIAYRDIKEAGNNLFERYLKYEIMTPKAYISHPIIIVS